jgi:hypothetical protein
MPCLLRDCSFDVLKLRLVQAAFTLIFHYIKASQRRHVKNVTYMLMLTSLRIRSAFAGLGWFLFLIYLSCGLQGHKYPGQENQQNAPYIG